MYIRSCTVNVLVESREPDDGNDSLVGKGGNTSVSIGDFR